MLAMALVWFVILFVAGWFFFRPGGWLSDEESPKRGRRKG